MSKAELSKNRALSGLEIIDLNEDPVGLSRKLGKEELEKWDAAICSVSIDYLVKPREMLADLAKLLKKDASVHLAFSNRCFPTKVRYITCCLPTGTCILSNGFIAGRRTLAAS